MSSGETVRQYNGHHKGSFHVMPDVNLPVKVAITTAAVCCALHDGAG
jgi:hypothetical protein